MASGSFKTGWGTYDKDYELQVIWSSTSNIVSNSSVVNLIIRLYCPYTLYISARKNNKVVINGIVYYYDTPSIGAAGQTVALANITSKAIPHNADGSKNVSISVNFNLNAALSGVAYGVQTATKTVALDNIPRAATITAAPNFNDEENPTITYSNLAGSAVDELKACISFDGSKDDIAYRDISKTGTSYTFNLTTAERNVLRNATTTANSRTVRFYIQTEIGGETFRKSITKTLTIVNANPTINPTVKDTGSVSTVLTGDEDNKVIKEYNTMAITIGAAALKGATVKSKKVTCGGKSLTADGTLRDVTSGDFVFSVTDSRGNTTTKTIKKTLINYVNPTCNLVANAPTTGGDMSITVKGNYFNGSFGAVANTLTVQYRYKTNNGAFGEWQTIASPTITNNTYAASVNFTGLDYLSTYTFEARTTDKIQTIDSAAKTVKTTPVFDWGEDDFQFNVPVSLANGKPLQGVSGNGENVNIAYVTTGTNNVQIGGGAYAPTNIFMNTKDNAGTVSINGKAYGVNRVLWSGAYYMTEGQTANLAEPVSEQASGIILIFSRYDITNSEALNEHFSSHFIPKQLVALQEGKGSIFNMNTATYSYAGSKYLYIDDTAIRGNANNDAVGTGENGIKYNNNRYVLRYVIGV